MYDSALGSRDAVPAIQTVPARPPALNPRRKRDTSDPALGLRRETVGPFSAAAAAAMVTEPLRALRIGLIGASLVT